MKMDTKRTMIMALAVLALVGCFAFAAVQETDAAVAFVDEDIKGQDDTANDKMSVTYFEKDSNYAIQVEATGVGSLPVKLQISETEWTWTTGEPNSWVPGTPVITTSTTSVAFNEKAILFTGQLKSTVVPNNPEVGAKKYTYDVSILDKDGVAVSGYSANLLVGQYVVVYNANGGTGTTDPLKVTMAYNVAPVQTAVDFKMDYHNKANASGYTWLDAPEGNVKDISSALNKNTVVYAKWTMDTYKVTFDSNKGSASTDPTGNMPPQTDIVYGTPTALTTCGFTLPGYEFQGWDANNDGTVDYENGASVSGFADETHTSPALEAQDATLKAVWQAKAYTIVFNSNAPTGTQSVATGSTAEKVITFDAAASALTENGFSLTGYTFLGWTLEAVTTAQETLPTGGYADKANVSISASVWYDKEAATEIPLYAVWKANTYTITFDLNMPTGALPYQTTDSSAAYYVPLPVNIENVKYDANQVLANFEWETKTGIWSFAGWCLDQAGHATVYEDGAIVKNLATGGTGDLTATLYALWTATALFELEVKEVTTSLATINGADEMSNTGTVVLLSTNDANKKFTDFTVVSGGAAAITASNLIYFDGTHGTDAYLIITPADTAFTGGVSITFTVADDPAVGNIKNFYISKFNGDLTTDQAQIHIDATTGGIPAGKLSVSGVWYTEVTVNSNSVTGYGNIDVSATGVNKDAKYFNTGETPGDGVSAVDYPIAAHTASLDKIFDLDGVFNTQTYNLYSIKFAYTSDDDTPVTASTIWAVIS